jgi:hypothetical protein
MVMDTHQAWHGATTVHAASSDKPVTAPLGPTLIVEEDARLAQDIHARLDAAGLAPLQPCLSYDEALRQLAEHQPRLCVLECDLGQVAAPNPDFGQVGRRLLAILDGRGCRTLAYVRDPAQAQSLRGLHPTLQVLCKSQPPETLVDRLLRMAQD